MRIGKVLVLSFFAFLYMSLNGRIAAAQTTQEVIDDVVAASRILGQHGILDGYGHVSARHPEYPDRLLISRSRPAPLITAEDIIEVDLDGNGVDPNAPQTFEEVYIHAEIYRARPEVNAVVHSHSPTAIGFGISSVPIQAIHGLSAFILLGIPIWDYRSLGIENGILVDNQERGRNLVETLADKPAVLMRNHGAAIVGTSMSQAVGRSIYLEQAAEVNLQARSLGGEVHYLELEGDAIAERAETDYDQAWELWRYAGLPDAAE